MTHRWLLLLVALVIGGMTGAYVRGTFVSDTPEREGISVAAAPWPAAPLAKRQVVADPDQLIAMFDSLYAILAEEVEERRKLQEAVTDMRRDLEAIRKVAPALFTSTEVENDSVDSVPENREPQSRLELFINAGFDETQAADLQKREDELAMQELYLRDQASREDWINSPRFRKEYRELQQNRYSIRDELGDDDYDRYLYAIGQPNRISVMQVLETSPAKQAGLAEGDLILSYDGKRVFSLRELSALTAQGDAGESVPMNISRDGQQLQIWIPRGPIGFQSGGDSANPNAQN